MRRWLVVVLVAVAAITGGACTRAEARPAGVTERWLQAVSDQGREGLLEESEKRASEYGEPGLADEVIPANPEEDERYFSDLEVGASLRAGGTARVPFRVTVQLADDEREDRFGTAVLTETDGDWRVTTVDARRPGEQVPSEGGERPARASLGHWVFTVALSFVLTVGSVLLVRSQPAPPPPPVPAG